MNGNQNFVVNWKCGCVFSEKAVQEASFVIYVKYDLVQIKANNCYGCSGPWDPKDALVLNPENVLLEEYKARLVAEKAEKKAKKVKNVDIESSWFNMCSF